MIKASISLSFLFFMWLSFFTPEQSRSGMYRVCGVCVYDRWGLEVQVS